MFNLAAFHESHQFFSSVFFVHIFFGVRVRPSFPFHFTERTRAPASAPGVYSSLCDTTTNLTRETRRLHMGILEEALVAYTYVGVWISLSAGVILYNKFVLTVFGFPFPVALTMIHMAFCSSLVGDANCMREGGMGGGGSRTRNTARALLSRRRSFACIDAMTIVCLRRFLFFVVYRRVGRLALIGTHRRVLNFYLFFLHPRVRSTYSCPDQIRSHGANGKDKTAWRARPSENQWGK